MLLDSSMQNILIWTCQTPCFYWYLSLAGVKVCGQRYSHEWHNRWWEFCCRRVYLVPTEWNLIVLFLKGWKQLYIMHQSSLLWKCKLWNEQLVSWKKNMVGKNQKVVNYNSEFFSCTPYILIYLVFKHGVRIAESKHADN